MIVVLNLATDHVLTSFMSMIPIVVRVKCLEKKEKIEDSIKWKLRMWKKVRDGEVGNPGIRVWKKHTSDLLTIVL